MSTTYRTPTDDPPDCNSPDSSSFCAVAHCSKAHVRGLFVTIRGVVVWKRLCEEDARLEEQRAKSPRAASFTGPALTVLQKKTPT